MATKKKTVKPTRKVAKKAAPRKRATRKRPVDDGYPVSLLGDVARQKWREVEPQLRERMQLLGVDWGILVLYCNCWERLTQAQKAIAKDGLYERVGSNGASASTAARVDENRLMTQIRQLSQELGMSIKARKGVKMTGGDSSELQAFLHGG
jgi:P27 family predicted phage terminase small subunit